MIIQIIMAKDVLTDIPGVGAATATLLEKAGFKTFMSIAVMTPKGLAGEVDGISSAGAEKMIEEAKLLAKLGSFYTTTELIEKRKNLQRLTTSSPLLDSLFGGGGLETTSISEFYGEFGSGKCVGKDTPIIYFKSDTAYIDTVKEIFDKHSSNIQMCDEGEVSFPDVSMKVLSFDEERGIVKENVSNFYREKVKEIEELKTDRGNVVKITKDHPLLTLTDEGLAWKSVGMLHAGDYIAVPKEVNFSVNNNITEDDAYFIGMFVAEGTSNPLSISNTSEDIINKVVAYSVKKFGRAATHDNYDRVLLYKRFREVLGDLAECNSSNMFIPDDIMNSGKNIVAAFVAGYFDGDGYYGAATEFVTKSKRLSIQMNYLLLKLGVNTTISDKIIDEGIYYRTFITEPSSKKKLFKILTEATKNLDILKTDNNSTKYGIPAAQFLTISRRMFTKMSGTHRKETVHGKKELLNSKYGTVYSNYLTKNKSVSEVITHESAELILELLYEKMETMGRWYDRLENPIENDIFEALEELPFQSKEIADEIGMKKGTFNNFTTRKSIPIENVTLIAEGMRRIIAKKVSDEQISKDLKTMITLCSGMVGWERIETLETKPYNDYVYDLVVENTHNFIGGEKPLLLHNTQICFQLAVNATMPVADGGLDGHVIVIDTENTFRPIRIEQIATAHGLDVDEVNSKIHVARAYNSAHQMLLLTDKADELAKQVPVRLLIVDSLVSLFRSEYIGRGNLADRQGLLNTHMHDILKFTDAHNAVAAVTNQVLTNPGQMFGDPTKPVGGNIIGHNCEVYDTLIQQTDGSIVKIGKMTKANRVKTVNWNSNTLEDEDVSIVTHNPDITKVYTIHTNNQNTCSGGHRFFKAENDEVVETEAKDLKVGDFIAQARRINIDGTEQKLPTHDVIAYVTINKNDGDKLKHRMREFGYTQKELSMKLNISPKQLRNILNQQYPTTYFKAFKLISMLHYADEVVVERVFSRKHRDLKFPEIMTPALAQLYGYFLGDGNFEETGLRFTDAREEVLQEYSRLFKQEFNIDATVKKSNTKNCHRLYVNSKEIRDIFENIYDDIYNLIGKSRVDVVNAFVKGFVDAEGYISKKQPRISVHQKDEERLRTVQLLLLRSGIRSTIGKKTTQDIWELKISNKDIVRYGQIGFTATDKQAILEGCINTAGLRNRWKEHELSNECILFEKIRKIEINDNTEALYDLTVPQNENYIANGMIVHNSTYRVFLRKGKGGKRVARMVDSPETPDMEAILSIGEEGVRDG